jgi:hypothetical protein
MLIALALSCFVVKGGVSQTEAGFGDDSSQGVYTLYRSSPIIGSISGEGARVHVSTFDAAAGEDYNRENCQNAATLFASQPGVTVRYWCEKGRYRP